MTDRTADELVAEGRRLIKRGSCVVFLYPSQEWMAVELQTPFLRYDDGGFYEVRHNNGEQTRED